MKLWSDSFQDGQPIPGEYAFCVIDPKSHVTLSDNRNPHLAWDDVPAGTRSFVLICHDVDVPSKPDDLFKDDREIPSTLPRVEFYHWVLVDIPAGESSIPAGSYSKEVTPRGKAGPATPQGARRAHRSAGSSWTGAAARSPVGSPRAGRRHGSDDRRHQFGEPVGIFQPQRPNGQPQRVDLFGTRQS